MFIDSKLSIIKQKPVMFSSLVFLFFHFETIFRVVTPDKKLLWALHQWKNPDLGPSSNIQLLEEKGMAEKGELQR